jgi:HlyD family secretion protein
MDKVIEKKSGWSAGRWALVVGLPLAVALVAWQVVARSSTTRLTVDATRLTTGVVAEGEFLEYYPFDGRVEPATSVYLDIEEGGRVDEVVAEGGQHVEKGDLILRFSNASLQRSTIDTEAQLLYTLDIQRNSQFSRAQGALLLKESLLELDHQIEDMENKYRRYQALMSAPDSPISAETFETVSNQLKFLKSRRSLMAARIEQEDAMVEQQLRESRDSVERLGKSRELLARTLQSLEVRAPISGYLSTIDAQVGQNITRGQRIGQIDLLDRLKLRTRVDQFYVGRVDIGTPGRLEFDGRTWDVVVRKVYPEVKQNAFEVDVEFVGEAPEGLKRGLTLPVDLTFGAPTHALLVPRGGFYQQTSGRWVYLVSPDGRSARKTPVRLGKQNPRHLEVLEGLRPGDRIVTSGYDSFNGADVLRFDPALKPSNKVTP